MLSRIKDLRFRIFLKIAGSAPGKIYSFRKQNV